MAESRNTNTEKVDLAEIRIENEARREAAMEERSGERDNPPAAMNHGACKHPGFLREWYVVDLVELKLLLRSENVLVNYYNSSVTHDECQVADDNEGMMILCATDDFHVLPQHYVG
ncbi:hypothetical protein HKD37_08G021988 [Glycine soja]